MIRVLYHDGQEYTLNENKLEFKSVLHQAASLAKRTKSSKKKFDICSAGTTENQRVAMIVVALFLCVQTIHKQLGVFGSIRSVGASYK